MTTSFNKKLLIYGIYLNISKKKKLKNIFRYKKVQINNFVIKRIFVERVPIQTTYSTRHARCNGFFCLFIIEILLICPACMNKRVKKEQGGTCKIWFYCCR